ncbi:LOW QUALITY PROTEIN: olfactory receptor 1038-like [Eumetopias jubatus]|uniref:LOW QUALITY PROTEIN: olfactory receptor 1038-like n=1 Tax=Eumetopias jubatus TaxID=34886 RepID=UPI001016E57B|nr:LOW QUALITY PROTEIN: olfactory receptor 1038-like [Eumetopias jubatus]
MANVNITYVTEFILKGITDRPELQAPCFVVFFIIYLVTVLGNLGLITLIRIDTQLHTPMYYFLSHLAFVDLCYSSAITPKMMVVVELNTIPFHACATQLGCFLAFVITECFLLASMAYDRYVAICSPLHYSILMSRRLCIQLVAVPYIYSFLVALFHTIITFRLTYCGPKVINHFYCDDFPLLALSCSDTHMKEILIFAFAGFDMICSSSIILTSYIFIIAAILRIRSTQGRCKAISTCGSHMVAVTIFYGTLIFMYLQPKSNHSLDTDKMASVFYTVVIPMLNPLIYSLRNKEVEDASKKALDKGCETLKLLKLRK